MAKKTGFEKFASSHAGSRIKDMLSETPSAQVEREVPEMRREEDADRHEVIPQVQESVPAEAGQGSEAARPQRGRPKQNKTEEMKAKVYPVSIPNGMRAKLETIQAMTYKSSLKDVFMEALSDIIKKYNI